MATESRLRSTVRQERDLVASLVSKVTTAPQLRQLLDLASGQLDIVEHCLSKEELTKPRTPAELAWWLGQTESLLNAASLQTKYVGDMVNKFGPNLRTL
jgi:hypothetical protein